MTEPIIKAKVPAERNVACRALVECHVATGSDAETGERYVTLRPNPEHEKVIYAMTPELAMDLVNALLESVKRKSN
jgi:hypothetical protein